MTNQTINSSKYAHLGEMPHFKFIKDSKKKKVLNVLWSLLWAVESCYAKMSFYFPIYISFSNLKSKATSNPVNLWKYEPQSMLHLIYPWSLSGQWLSKLGSLNWYSLKPFQKGPQQRVTLLIIIQMVEDSSRIKFYGNFMQDHQTP